MNLEEKLAELNDIVKKLESGELSFEDATKNFERGHEIAVQLIEKIKNEKGKISVIKQDLDKIIEEEFD